jgi:hypothetical protein
MSGGPGQLLTAVAGAAIGFALGGPTGAAIGWSLGTMAGGIIWPMDGGSQQGPRLSDKTAQTSSYGVPIPKVYGSFRLAGNVIWATDIVETEVTKRVGKTLFSKGTKVTSYSYTGNFAVAVCAGPIASIGRIWADSKLIHDPYKTGKYDSYIRKYLGTETQLPDSAIQADQGADITPAFRGTAYVRFAGLPLADFGNRIPIIHVEIGGVAVAESYRDGSLINLSQSHWSYNPTVPGKIANTLGEYVSVINTATLTAVQFKPADVTGVVEAMTASHGAIYGPAIRAADYSRAHIDPVSGDVIVVLQGTTSRGGVARFSLAGGVPTLVYAVAKFFGTGAGQTWLFDGRLFMVDQFTDYLYCYDIATGATLWTKSLASYGDAKLATAGSTVLASATYRATDGVIFLSMYAASSDATKTWVARLNAASGALLTSMNGFLPETGSTSDNVYLTFDGASGTLLAFKQETISSHKVYRLNADTLATIASYTIDPFSTGAFSDAAQTNFGTNNAIDGTFYLSSAGHTFRQYETATMSLLWSGTLSSTSGVVPPSSATDFGNPLPIVGQGRQFFGYGSGGQVYNFGTVGSLTNLAAIVSDICDSCELAAADYDVTALADQSVTGYAVTREITGRAAIEPLMSAYAIDAMETGGKLAFRFRKTSADATIPLIDLGSSGDEGSERVIESRRQEIELPAAVTVSYASQALDYQTNTQSYKRIDDTIEAGDPRSQEYPIVLADADALTLAARLLFLAWIERTSYAFSLPTKYLYLDPGDVLDLPLDGDAARVLLTKVDFGGDGVVKIEAMATDALVYLSPPGPPVIPIFPAQSVPTLETTTPLVLDTPLLDDDDDAFGYYLGAEGESQSWSGGAIYASKDGTSYEYAATVTQETALGTATTALPFHSGALIDRTNIVRVVFPTAPLLSSITELDLLAGGNRLMIGSELLGFATVTPVSATTFDLSVLLRCCQGTEWAADHAIGETVTLLANVEAVDEAIGALNQPRYFKGVSVGGFVDDVTSISFTPTGVRLKPLSPVHITGSRDGSNNLSMTWFRRARVDADWRDGAETPLDEAVEAYEIDVLSGSTVLRTITSSAAAASYSATDMTADGITPGAPVTVRIYQISSRVGRGYPGEATL